MNKKDFWTSVLFNLGTAILFIEHLCGLALALEFLIGWTIISLLVHINILRDYVRLTITED